MASVHEALAGARRALVDAGIPPGDAALDAEVLARHVLGWDRAALVARGREDAPAGFDAGFAALVARRATREPIAYITGIREFWTREFEVNRDVLIPRPETEFVVEEALEVARTRSVRIVVDVGTGSGCIAVTLALELPNTRVAAIDVSPAAIEVARRNAERHGVASRMTFAVANLLDGISGPIDLIVSNPPYLAPGDEPTLQPEVARYEPRQALYAGGDGLDSYRRLFPVAARCLADEGVLVVEFGFGQEMEVRALARSAGLAVVRVARDLQGIPRVAVLRRSRVEDCLFCKIIAGEIPGTVVYKDERVVVLKDINPQAPMHLLVIPRRHVATLNDLDKEDDTLVGEMIRRAAAVAAENGYAESGYRTVFNVNEGAGQTVFHIHLHVLGGRRFTWPPG